MTTNKDWYVDYRLKREKNDANIIAIRGIYLGGIPFAILWLSNKLGLLLVLTVALCLLLGYNFYDIYVKYNDKYKQGHSYVKRKFHTVGLAVIILDVIILELTIVFAEYSKQFASIFLAVAFLAIVFSVGYLVNNVWYNFDQRKYGEIDKRNPYQKRYRYESKRFWGKNEN